MKYFLGALALCLAVPAAAQTGPATDPHAGHAQHQSATPAGAAPQGHAAHRAMAGMDHAKMMDDCKKAMAEDKCEEHCKAMMRKHETANKVSSVQPADPHAGHAQ